LLGVNIKIAFRFALLYKIALFAALIAIAVINRYTILSKLLAAFITASVAIIIIKLILIIIFFKLSLPITAAAAFFLLGKIRLSFSDKFARFVKKIGLKQIN